MNTEQQTPALSHQKPYTEMSFEERMAALKEQQSELTRGAARRRKAWNAEKAKRNSNGGK